MIIPIILCVLIGGLGIYGAIKQLIFTLYNKQSYSLRAFQERIVGISFIVPFIILLMIKAISYILNNLN